MTTNVPMAWAASELARVCNEMDAAKAIDAFLDKFDDASLTLGDAVDRRIAVDREIKSQLVAQEMGYRYYRARKALLQAIHTRFKERTRKILEESDPGVRQAFRGKLGKISLSKSTPAVEYSFGTKEVTAETAVMFGVPIDYLITKISYEVDAPRVRAELKSGKTLEWASIRQGTHARFPANPGEKDEEGNEGEIEG